MRKLVCGVSDQVLHIRPVQLQKKLDILEIGRGALYYPCRENKDVDQLCSYCTADLHL